MSGSGRLFCGFEVYGISVVVEESVFEALTCFDLTMLSVGRTMPRAKLVYHGQ